MFAFRVGEANFDWRSLLLGGRSGGIGFSLCSQRRGGNSKFGIRVNALAAAALAPFSSFLFFEQHENGPRRSTVAYSIVLFVAPSDCPFLVE